MHDDLGGGARDVGSQVGARHRCGDCSSDSTGPNGPGLDACTNPDSDA